MTFYQLEHAYHADLEFEVSKDDVLSIVHYAHTLKKKYFEIIWNCHNLHELKRINQTHFKC